MCAHLPLSRDHLTLGVLAWVVYRIQYTFLSIMFNLALNYYPLRYRGTKYL